MNDRVGQVWRKTSGCKGAKYDMVVLESTSKSKTLGTKDGQELTSGTLHLLVRYMHRTNEIERTDWYEPSYEPWEGKMNMVRVL